MDTNYTPDQLGIMGGVPPDYDRSPLEHRTYIPPVSGRFRALPLMDMDIARAKHCHRNGGHILTVRGREIVCLNCPVVWKDEGF